MYCFVINMPLCKHADGGVAASLNESFASGPFAVPTSGLPALTESRRMSTSTASLSKALKRFTRGSCLQRQRRDSHKASLSALE